MHYVTRGFRRGMSLNPLFDDIVAGAELPEVLRVPALYAYLLSERETVRVHPWWDAEEYGRVHGGAGLEHAWANMESAITLRAAGRSVTLSVAEVRQVALRGARSWPRHRARPVVHPATGANGIVRPIQARDRRYARKLSQAASRAVAPRHEAVVIPLVGVDASQWVSAHVLATVVPEIILQGHPRRAAWTRVIDEASADLNVHTVVALDPRAEFTDDEIDALLDATDDRHVAMPAQRAHDGTVDGLGAAETGGAAPWAILCDHPVEDLAPLDAIISAPLLHGRSLALSHAVLRDVLESEAPVSCAQFARALRPRAGVRVLTTVRPVLDEPLHIFDEKTPRERGRTGDRQIAAAIIEQVGFDLLAWQPGNGVAIVPFLRWRRPHPDAQRWAIKICAPAGRQGAVWGDMHFARGLASALRRRGHTVIIDAFDARDRPTAYLDDVNIVVRGPYRIDPLKTGINLQWIISHPDEISRNELVSFDRVFAASVSWSEQVGRRWGIEITPLLEATDVDLFTPGGVARTEEIVFVGTARGIARPSVVAPLRAGIPVRVYGPDWRPFIPHSAIAARALPHADLARRYESASIVLNDQWPAMRRHGFIAMRPFDVVAVGGRVISEDVEGIGEIFGGAVVTYRDAEHLVELLRTDPETLFPDRETLARIAERVRKEHSFDARATVLIEAARDADRGLRR